MFSLQPKLTPLFRTSFYSSAIIAIIISSCNNSNNAIFESYRSLNESLSNETEFVSEQNSLLYKSVENNSKDPMSATQTARVMPQISRVREKSRQLTEYLHDKEFELVRAMGIKPYYFKYDINDDRFRARASQFVDEAFAKELNERMNNYRDSVFLFDDVDNVYIKRVLSKFKPEDSATNQYLQIEASSITKLPAIAILVLIRNYEVAARKIEHSLIRYFHMFTVYQDCGYDKLLTMAVLNSTVVKLGEPIEVTAGIAAFSLSCRPEILINGKRFEPGVDGAAIYRFKPRKAGKYSIIVSVKYFDFGVKKTDTRKLNYEVIAGN